MAKNKNDIILRDRMQFDFAAGGERTTLYGRIDLSDFVNVVRKDGLLIKELFFQPRVPTGEAVGGVVSLTNTGAFSPYMSNDIGVANDNSSALKLFATTRAYQDASEVGIASPDVVAIEEWFSYYSVNAANTVAAQNYSHTRYGPTDLHPDGFLVVSDLLIGIAADNCIIGNVAGTTMEVDILMIAEPTKITSDRLDEMLAQAQDL